MTAVNRAGQMFMRGRGYVIIGSWNLQRDAPIKTPPSLPLKSGHCWSEMTAIKTREQ